MNSSASDAFPTAGVLRRMSRPVRSLDLAAWIGAAVGGTFAVLGVSAWVARLGWFDPPYWVLVAWGMTGLALVAMGWWAWRRRERLSLRAQALALESSGPWRRGTLTAMLVPPAPGTSAMLFRAADLASARDLETRGRPVMDASRRAALGRATRGALLLGGGLLLLGSAGPLRGSASELWRPLVAWHATTAPVRLRASREMVNRGESVALELEAIGRRDAVLFTRSPGETWRQETILLDDEGRATRTLGPLASDLHARLTSGGRTSETVTVEVRPPAFLGSLSVIAQYPSYLDLADEPLPTNGDTLLLPAGTRLSTRGEATADLAEATWTQGAKRYALEPTGPSFEGRFFPSRSGVYTLHLRTLTGAPLAGDTIRLPVRIVVDSAPVVDIPVPGTDTLLPVTLRIPLVVDARDDHGLRRLELWSRRVSRLGMEGPLVSEPLTLPEDTPARAIVSHSFDVNGRGLLPGDTIRYFVEATDNAPPPRAHAVRSREYVLRLPTMREIRAAARQATAEVQQRLDSLANQSRELERNTEDLSRERPRREGGVGGRNGQNDQSLAFEDAKRAEALAKAQEQLMQDAEELRDALEALRESAVAAGIDDPDWLARLEEIRDQLDRALSDELREKLVELQKALLDLDAERTKDALKRLAEAQAKLREVLERSRELFRRAAIEGDLANLAQESRELANRQELWNERVPESDSTTAAREQRDIASETDSLAAALEQLAEALDLEGEGEGEGREGNSDDALGELAAEAEQAADQMRKAAAEAARGQRPSAQRGGQQALETLRPIGEGLESERQKVQTQWRAEVAAALDRGLAEASRLTERQLALEESIRTGTPAGEVLAEQGVLEEGVERLIEQMQAAAGKNALVSPNIAGALAAARLQMRRARDALAPALPDQREGADRAGQAVDALNAAAFQMLRSRGDVVGAGSGSGLSEALERLNQLAQQQGKLGQQSGGLLPLAGGGALREELRRLAGEQRRLAQEMERLRATGHLPNTGPLADEAKELARRLEAGRLDRQTVERQQRLFRRMLDAGRTLQGREEDRRKERQSQTARGDSVRLPPALRHFLQADESRIRLPSWEELQRLSPEERRLVADYFRRLADETP